MSVGIRNMPSAPDLIILNGILLIFNPAQPSAQALAVSGGKISAVGSTTEIRELAGANTQIIDAAGGTVLPGFIDSHVHLFGGATEPIRVVKSRTPHGLRC